MNSKAAGFLESYTGKKTLELSGSLFIGRRWLTGPRFSAAALLQDEKGVTAGPADLCPTSGSSCVSYAWPVVAEKSYEPEIEPCLGTWLSRECQTGLVSLGHDADLDPRVPDRVPGAVPGWVRTGAHAHGGTSPGHARHAPPVKNRALTRHPGSTRGRYGGVLLNEVPRQESSYFPVPGELSFTPLWAG